MPAASLPLIGPEQVALLSRRLSVIVGSADATRRPHLMRATGFRPSDDRRRMTVLLRPSGAQAVLADLRQNGRIAVVFSEPTTDRTLQIKGSDAQVTPATDDDARLAARYLEDFIGEIGQLGFAAEVAHTLFADEGGLLAVSFTIEAAFEQTPGPAAGEPLAAHAS
jgi:hypothetical protein